MLAPGRAEHNRRRWLTKTGEGGNPGDNQNTGSLRIQRFPLVDPQQHDEEWMNKLTFKALQVGEQSDLDELQLSEIWRRRKF